MITNRRQYEFATKKKRKLTLEKVLVSRLRLPLEASGLIEHETQRIAGLIEDIDEDIQEYKGLQRGDLPPPDLQYVASLPSDLIRARISLNWTQEDLAQAASLKEQTIQRYESTGYASAKFKRIMEISSVLTTALEEKTGTRSREICSNSAS